MKIRISIQNGFCVASWLVADSQAPLHSQVLQFLLLLSGCLRETGCFPGAQTVKNLPAIQDTWVRSLDQEVPQEKGVATHSSILALGTPWTEELCVVPGVAKSWTRLSS